MVVAAGGVDGGRRAAYVMHEVAGSARLQLLPAGRGMPPTGARVDVQLIDIMRFDRAGLVCEHWGVADMLSLMQQLGAVPAGPPA